jgi:peptidyl-prolyl cis-trans isomerase D
MLEILRKSASSWVAKILFGLLILSFGVWGIGDVIRGGADQAAAITVGDIEIGPGAVRQQFDRTVDRLRQSLGDTFTAEQARRMGFLDATVREMVTSATLDMAARDMDITVSEDALRRTLRESQAFQDGDGGFSPDRFRRLLAANNLTEDRYLALLRGDLLRQRLASALATGVAPDSLVGHLHAYREERRTAEVLRIDAAALEVTETPDEDALHSLYDAGIDRFTAPEYRGGVALLLRQEDLLDRVEVSDQAIVDHYEANRDRYTLPGKRAVSQVVAADQDTAAEVARLAQSGTPLAEAAATAGANAPVDMGEITPDALPADASDAVFALDEGAVSAPVQTALGWHVFKVSSVTPASERPLDAVHDEIRDDIARERVVDILYDESATLDDTLGGGATLEEAADRLDLPLIVLPPVSADGTTADGTAAKALPEGEAGHTILGALFDLETGLDSRLLEIPGGYAVVRADAVVPPAPRPFEAVEDELRTQWAARLRQDKAEALAKDLAQEAGGPRTIAALADTSPAVTAETSPPLTRGAARQGKTDLPASLIDKLFAMAPGQTAWSAAPGGAVVVRLATVEAADPAADSDSRKVLEQSLRGQIGQDLMSQALTAFGNRFGVEINDAALQQAF